MLQLRHGELDQVVRRRSVRHLAYRGLQERPVLDDGDHYRPYGGVYGGLVDDHICSGSVTNTPP